MATKEELKPQRSTNEQRAKLKAEAIAVNRRAYQLYQDDDWNHYQTHKDVTLSYKESPENSGEIIRIDMTVDAPVDVAISALLPLHIRAVWDPDVKEYVIEELDENIQVMHTTYVTRGFVAKLISPRDFCRLEYVKKHNDDLSSMTYTSVDHPGCKQLKGFVRGVMYTSGFFCQRNLEDRSKTDVVFIYHLDPKVPIIPYRLLRFTIFRRGFQMADQMKAAILERNEKTLSSN
ncbi:stAR-related lipid transfer protein 5-like isoform X2 [Amphiura filiformis]|uniref:stAR-related lipid transfer protein 5-like isoform X2 n=1 Tax=Amphiura filiformis TaxID=82378 RepID=UPI003B21389F